MGNDYVELEVGGYYKIGNRNILLGEPWRTMTACGYYVIYLSKRGDITGWDYNLDIRKFTYREHIEPIKIKRSPENIEKLRDCFTFDYKIIPTYESLEQYLKN